MEEEIIEAYNDNDPKTAQLVYQTLMNSVDDLKFLLDESALLLEHFAAIQKSIIKTFTYCALERLNVASISLHTLYGKYLSERKYEFSIGIIMRTVYLDYLILLNALEIVFRNNENNNPYEEELSDFCLTMLSDSAIHALKYFDSNKVPQEKLARMYSLQVHMHEECFEPYAHDGTKPILKKKKSFSQQELVKRLKKSSYPHLSRKEDAYMFYSKYDHFGKMYHKISRRPLTAEFIHLGENLRELPRSLALIVVLLRLLAPEDVNLIADAKRVEEYIQKMDGRET